LGKQLVVNEGKTLGGRTFGEGKPTTNRSVLAALHRGSEKPYEGTEELGGDQPDVKSHNENIHEKQGEKLLSFKSGPSEVEKGKHRGSRAREGKAKSKNRRHRPKMRTHQRSHVNGNWEMFSQCRGAQNFERRGTGEEKSRCLFVKQRPEGRNGGGERQPDKRAREKR